MVVAWVQRSLRDRGVCLGLVSWLRRAHCAVDLQRNLLCPAWVNHTYDYGL